MKNVSVIEARTNVIVFTYPIHLGGINKDPTEEDYENEAWRCAVEDKLVDPHDRASYKFLIH